MVKIYPFAALRPASGLAPAIAAVPYDVVTAEEARSIIRQEPDSFLRVSRSDAELPDVPPHDNRVYQRARENFLSLIKSGRMFQDPSPAMYVYRVRQDGSTFTGLCCCIGIDDYRNNRIRCHEQTRYVKEEDRTRHIETIRAHNGPVVLLYRDTGTISSFLESVISAGQNPSAEVTMPHGAIHQIFVLTDSQAIAHLETLFDGVPALYIADGHHRAKAAVNVADRTTMNGLPSGSEVQRFMVAMFAHDRVRIHGYSRLLTDLGDYTQETFLHQLRKWFTVEQFYGKVDGSGYNIRPHRADHEKFHIMHMYLGGLWYECTRPVDQAATLPEALDVSVLQKYVLEGMLGIRDPRSDARLQYLGGARPVADLEKLVDDGNYKVAFAMQPIRVRTVLAIADAGGVMPPKSTWFEPKLLSGLLVHTFS